MKTPKDTDLREALRRKFEGELQLPADFMKKPHPLSKARRKSTPLRGEGRTSPLSLRRSPLLWRRIGGGFVAASVLLLIMLNVGKQKPEQQTPVVAKEVTVPKDNMEETTQATAPEEVTELPVVAQAEKPKPAKKRRKLHKPALEGPPAPEAIAKEPPAPEATAEEPLPQEAEPVQAEPEQEDIYQPKQPDLYPMAVAEAQDIRFRGEHLYQEVDQILINAKNLER